MQDQPTQPRRLTRSLDHRIGGVCGGIADYFDVDATLVRIGFVLFAVLSIGPGALLLYALLWAIMPAADSNAPAHRHPARANGALLLGIVLVLVGISAGLQGLHLLWWWTTGMARFGWPVALIGAGVLIVVASRRR